MTELHFETATELVAKIKSKQISALELLEHFLGRVEQYNPALNAIIWMDTDAARARAKAADEAAAEAVIAAEEELIRALLGDIIFGVDEQSMETVVLGMLKERGLTLAVAEGLTGGVLSARLSDMDDTMAIFRGGSIKDALADAGQAATSIRHDFGADVGLAVVAAQADDNQPPGTVFMHLDIAGRQHVQMVSLPGDRARFRNYAVINVLNFLRQTLAAL